MAVIANKRELKTIQEHEKLNTVYAIDNPVNGGANHLYRVEANTQDDKNIPYVLIQFQQGARKEENSIHGLIDSDLLEIVRDRLTAFQNGEFACEHNAKALDYVEAALKELNKRVEDRINRKVLGTNNV